MLKHDTTNGLTPMHAANDVHACKEHVAMAASLLPQMWIPGAQVLIGGILEYHVLWLAHCLQITALETMATVQACVRAALTAEHPAQPCSRRHAGSTWNADATL